MTGTGQEVAKVLEDVAKKAGPALSEDMAGAYRKILHETEDGLKKNAGNVVRQEEESASKLASIVEKDETPALRGGAKEGGDEGGVPGTGGKKDDIGGYGGKEGGEGGGRASEGNGKAETGETDPVDVVSGQVITAEDDVDLPGLLPLLLRRAYASDYPGGRLFGPGWSSTLDQRVLVDDDGVHYVGDDAQVLHYPLPARPGQRVLPADGARWPLVWDRGSDTISIEDPWSGWSRHFTGLGATTSPGGAQTRPITALSDRNGRRIVYLCDEEGVPTQVQHSGGYRVAVDTVHTPSGFRVEALRLLDGTGPDGTTLLRYSYDPHGRLDSVIDSSGVPYQYEYDAADRMTAWTDRSGGRYVYEYDDAGRAVRGTGPDGLLSSTMHYDTEARVTRVTDSQGHCTDYHYDEHRHVVRIVDPLGNTSRIESDRYGRVLSRTDALGAVTAYGLDADGNVTRIRLPDGAEASAEYNELMRPVRITGPDGAEWRYTYDDRGNTTCATDPLGATTSFAYDDRGVLTAITDPLGAVTGVRADAHGLVTAFTDPLGCVTAYVRDGFGRIVEIVDSAGVTTRYGWTVEGLPAWREQPDGSREQWTYNPAGNTEEYRSLTGDVTSFTYTHFNLPTSRTGRDGARYRFAYDTELRLTSVTNPQGLDWNYEYDDAGRLTAETDFNGRRVTYTPDAVGDIVERVNGAGQRVSYVRDLLGRVTERIVGEHSTTLSYDAAGRLVGAAGPDGRLELVRDALGRIVAEGFDGRMLRSEFDAAGQRVTRTTPSGMVSRWQYDATGLPVSLATAAGFLSFEHDAAGRETTRFLGPAAALSSSYDEAGRLSVQSLWHYTAQPEQAVETAGHDYTLIRQRAFAYRADGQPLRVGEHEYDLDPLGRVTAVRAQDWSEQYAYDAAGNPTRAEATGVFEAGDTVGEREYTGTLVRRAGRTVYEYDGQGRVVRQTRRTLSGRQRAWRYTWNADDRLTGVDTPDGSHWTYRYDAMGRRVAKHHTAPDGTPGESVLFAWDGTVLAEQTTIAADGTPGASRTWDYEPDSYKPAAQTDHRPLPPDADQAAYDAAFYAIVTDLVGTPSELVTGDGRVVWARETDVWGRPPEPPNTAATDGAAAPDVDCPLGFPGQYRDDETGWHYNYARYYDPATSRFASPDPLGLDAAPNQHAYVENPLASSDPTGLVKSDAQLLADAAAIHAAYSAGRTGAGARIAQNSITVATSEFNGHHYYTVSNNRTSPAVRQAASNLGYTRISGKRYTKPNSTDAEQIMLNAYDKNRLQLPGNAQGRIAPSRPACGPRRQDCRGRIAGYPNITLVE